MTTPPSPNRYYVLGVLGVFALALVGVGFLVLLVYLGICYSSHDACKTGGAPWTRLSDSIAVTIQ